ncbi:DUF3179 domain-containing (seleno)protein [Shimia abyssi]|uniref:Uncharacterized protein DUF3179 n=1 Tax=Shimia abyssi TaxID=1662395 RepID=A0A2P8F6Z0_9RHOB|nr:DUF3179 domain-containing (seleno)protein [Shimia abyssi]PSL17478.1 uncharacterized protein DUF3179 [Shimia abyssi]
MIVTLVYWLSLIVTLAIGFVYFRDLGDVSQMVLKVKRSNMLRFIRHEYTFLIIGGVAFAVFTVVQFLFSVGPLWIWLFATALVVLLYGFPYIWVHVGLRNQSKVAEFVSIAEARAYVAPSNQVLVMENNGVARAHPQAQLLRPHLAGNDEGLNGENVIMTYCAMANLGIGYTPEIEGETVDLDVLAQHGNNLVLRDNKTGEPVQQIYGFRERDIASDQSGPVCPMRPTLAMRPWPTFRMTFRAFEKAYPDGTVFINKPSSNPILFLFDMALEMLFAASIERQHREAKPVMDNMTHYDERLPNKTYVWGIDIDGDAVCWTDDFVIDQGGLVNATVGGRPVVAAWDPRFESLGVWYNDTGESVQEIDFFGDSPAGRLERVEGLRPGLFWHVWVEFFPHTDLNRLDDAEADTAASSRQA